ncbi:pre-mRNA splicing factor CLF1 [Xylaria flabelliformis]|nr:pre-mRNA splicing factor CLF1 [Xylaria flabelliformis]
MSLPEPPVTLAGGCTVIYNNTLYSYSEAGFQSLQLDEGAAWKKLPSGQSVNGAVCVGSTPKDPSVAGLFVVGGKSSQADYTGLQKFTYSTGKWETITPQVTVTKDRVYHSATYLNSTESLLVYAGTTDGTPNLSQQTFTIGTSKPYGVLAFQSDISSPGVAPILLPWSETQAALIGGNSWNTQVMLFDATVNVNGILGSWINSGVTLAEPLPKNSSEVKAAIIRADDGSKHLYTFDLTTLPNMVNRTVLIDANGAPVVMSAPVKPTLVKDVGKGNAEVPINERNLLATNWPPYNSTFAPNSTRTDYSIATDPNGLVVMSGGSNSDILCMFNAKANTWEDAMSVLGVESLSIQSTPLAPSTSTTSSPSTSSTSSSSSTISAASTTSAPPPAAVPASSTSSKPGLPPTTVLGIALGSIFGVALLLALTLLFLKRRQRRQSFMETGHARRASGIPEKDFFHEDSAKASGGYFRGHNQQDSQTSFSSLGIFMGKSQKPAVQRKGSSEKKRISSGSVYSKDIKHTISRPQPQMSSQPAFLSQPPAIAIPPESAQPKPRERPAGDQDSAMRRSSGWNRYWSGGSNSIIGFGGGSKSRPDTEVSDESSRYSDMNRMTQDSATVPPLQVNTNGRPSFHHVNSGSPTVSQYDLKIREGLSGQIERPISAVSSVSSSGYSSGIPPSVHEAWDPTAPKKPWGSERAPSSAYSTSTISENLYTTGLGAPSANRAPSGMGVSRQPQLAVASISTDMSWLNLGENDKFGTNSRPYN